MQHSLCYPVFKAIVKFQNYKDYLVKGDETTRKMW